MMVSAMGLGCWAIGGPAWRGRTPIGWGKVDDAESLRAIRRAVDLGVSFFDTADVYGCGHSERVLGEALAGARDRVCIATKFGNTFDEATKQAEGTDASPAGIRRACEASLRRLGIERIDLYQLHLGALDLAQAEEVRATLEELVAAGKIRAYGWSTDDADRARAFAIGAHCAAIQQQLNVFGGSGETLAVCERFGLASINRGPLAMGLLTGKYQAGSILPADDVRGPQSPDWMRFFTNGRPTEEFLSQLQSVREILASGGRTLAQGALAWLWGRSDRTIPIPGFKSVAQVEENAGAMRFGPLTKEQVREVETLLGRATR
jgi:aryl-alcohol dehydrogenase-like predicted oxidoreductase